MRSGIRLFVLFLYNIGRLCHQALLGVIVHLVRVKAAFRCQLVKCVLFCIAPVTSRVNVVSRPVGTIRIQIQPIAAVGVLLGKPGDDRIVEPCTQVILLGDRVSKPGDDRIVEPCTQVILLGDRVKLLAGEFEAIGDGFLLGRKVAPGSGAL